MRSHHHVKSAHLIAIKNECTIFTLPTPTATHDIRNLGYFPQSVLGEKLIKNNGVVGALVEGNNRFLMFIIIFQLFLTFPIFYKFLL